MAPQPDELLRLTKRYQELLELGNQRAMPRLHQAWLSLRAYNEADIKAFEEAIEALMGAVKQTAVSVSSGYLSAVTGKTGVSLAAEAVASSFDPREPFIATWNALSNGIPIDEAVAVGQRRAEAMLRTYMTSTARQSGDAFATEAGLGEPRWLRMTDGGACPWCIRVAQYRYTSSAQANFGHRNCGCTVVPDPATYAASALPPPIAGSAVPAPTAAAPIVERDRAQTLTEAQYAALKPGWSLPRQKKVIAELRATPEGRLLHDTLKGFQSGTSRQIPLLRTNIEKRLTGQALEPGAIKRVDNLLNAVNNNPLPAPKTLYRGMRLDGSPEDIVARYSKPHVDLNLSSFSSDKALAKDFTIKGAGQAGPRSKTQTGVLVELETGGAVKALPIENISPSRVFANEKEWLSGGRFEVQSVTQSRDGTVVLRLRQLAGLGE